MPKKKQRVQQEEETYSSDSNDDQIDDDTPSDSVEMVDPSEQITVDFEARSPEDIDYESIKLLLQQKLSQFSINLSEFAEIIIQQNHIGNVIYQAIDDEDVEPIANANAVTNDTDDQTIFGIISLINLNKYKQKSCTKQLVGWLNKEFDKLKKSKSFQNDNIRQFLDKNIFEQYKIGYLVNERYLNIPPEISIPMFESLLKDLEKSSNEISENAKASATIDDNDVDYWMILSKSYIEDNSTIKEFANAEEEVFRELSDYCVEIKYPKAKDSMQISLTLEVLFLSKAKINDSLNKIKSLVKK